MVTDIIFIVGAITSFLIILESDIENDYKKWKNEKPVKHGVEGRIRALWLLIPFLLLCFTIPLKVSWTPLGALFFLYWTFFDGLYNAKRHLNFWSLGTVDKGDAISDKILRIFPKPVQIIIKVVGSIIFLALYSIQLFR